MTYQSMVPLRGPRRNLLSVRLCLAPQQPCLGWTHSNLRSCVADHNSVYAIWPLIFRRLKISETLSTLEKDLDSLLQLGNPEATARRGAVGCFGNNSLMITTTPEGCFVHWKGTKLSDLLEAEDRLVAHLEPLPFQKGMPLATMAEESTELVEASSDELISRQVLMAEEGEDDGDLPIVEFDVISEDEATANAGDENDADREARRARNRACAVRRRRVNERMRSTHHELDVEFVAVSEQGFRTPVANVARVTTILERSNDANLHQALCYVQRASIQLDQQNPASTIREGHVGESRSQAHSQTAGGRPRPQCSSNNNNAHRSQATGGRQQPLQEATRDRLIIITLQKTCASESMKDAMRGP
jgi:hypothetical protein